ncbi:MAG: hypothetical protein AAFQ43_02015 [Bacteroidota bacterium]
MPFLVPIVAILAWAAVQVSKNMSAGGSANLDEVMMELAALSDDLDEAHAERQRLRARIESLEAIATAVDEPMGRLDLDALPDAEDVGSTARRQRTR